MHSRIFLLSFCFLIGCCMAGKAQVKFSTIISEREVGKDDYLQVEYRVENATSVESVTAPAFTNFSVASPPAQQNVVNVVNGAVSRYLAVAYILKPLSTGKFSIEGATAIIDGKKMRSNAVTVTVTNAAPRPAAPSANPFLGLNVPDEPPEVNEEYVLRKGESASAKIKDNILVKLDVSKTTCYAGEPIVATYKLYSRLKSESRVTKRPSLSQFSVYDMVQPEANNPSVEKLNGKLYNTHIIRKVQLYPLQDGSFDLDPVEVDNTIQFLRLEGNDKRITLQQLEDDYMSGLSGGKMEEQHVSLSSKPVTITVKPLPTAGKPVTFDGAVGKFTVSAMVPKADITAGETAALQLILKGQGNLTLINAPQVQWPADVEGYEPSVQENLDKTVAPITGSKLFEYSFMPKHAGKFVIPPIAFSYFDPAANAYKTVYTDSIVAEAGKALKRASSNSLFTDGHTPLADSNHFNWQKLLWLLPVLTLLLLVISFSRKKNASARNKIVAATAPAVEKLRLPIDYFEGARHALTAVNSQLFYKETGRAIWQILAEKFNLTSSQLNKPVVTRLLQQRNAPAEMIPLLEKVLNDCELALYTPVHTENDMRQTLEKAERLERLLNESPAV